MSVENESLAPMIELGVIVKPHGVRGAVKVCLHNPISTAIERCEEVTLVQDGESRRVKIQVLGLAGEQFMIQVDGVLDRSAAEALRGAKILADRGCLDPLDEDEYLVEDLVGCRVIDEQGQSLGQVSRVFSNGAGDILVVEAGSFERLIPLVEDWVVSVDVSGAVIQIRGAEFWEPQPK